MTIHVPEVVSVLITFSMDRILSTGSLDGIISRWSQQA